MRNWYWCCRVSVQVVFNVCSKKWFHLCNIVVLKAKIIRYQSSIRTKEHCNSTSAHFVRNHLPSSKSTTLFSHANLELASCTVFTMDDLVLNSFCCISVKRAQTNDACDLNTGMIAQQLVFFQIKLATGPMKNQENHCDMSPKHFWISSLAYVDNGYGGYYGVLTRISLIFVPSRLIDHIQPFVWI